MLFFFFSVSAITGAAEPIYGKEAFHSICDSVKGKNPFGKLTREDLEWRAPWSSNVETQVFYFTSKTGHFGFIQIIHSNPIGLHFTAQFTCRVFHESKPDQCVWSSTNLEDIEAKGTEFNAHNVFVSLSEDATEYTIHSEVDEEAIVDVKVKRVAEGFKIGQTGTSLYGDDPENPWGTMRHVFWPRCATTGTIKVKGFELELTNELSMYVMAIQGMKPHHAAAKWNFVNFQGPTSSVVVMDYTTPPSYGSCTVSLGAVTQNDKLLYTSSTVNVKHIEPAVDEVGWPVPHTIEFDINGPAIDATDEQVLAAKDFYKSVLTGTLKDNLLVRVDVMAELPGFVKKVATNLSGAKPYIYQFSDRKMKLKLVNPEGKEFEEEGHGYCEVTFISESA